MTQSPPLNEHGLPGSHRPDPNWERTPRQVHAALDAGDDLLLLDVRTEAELGTAAIPGATHLPMDQIPGRLQELTEHADRPVVVMCHLGRRSMQVTAFLRQQGFTDVHSMAGGIEAWSLGVDPSVPRY